jgi:hypothetical protein
MKIEVKQKHINEGGACTRNCPVASAIEEATGNGFEVYHNIKKVKKVRKDLVNIIKIYSDDKYYVPIEVKKFVIAYDKGTEVKPFSFNLRRK